LRAAGLGGAGVADQHARAGRYPVHRTEESHIRSHNQSSNNLTDRRSWRTGAPSPPASAGPCLVLQPTTHACRRCYTLADDDLLRIRRPRKAENRLGFPCISAP
jgi:hypothetical protein